uniref:Syntaxin-related protein(Knolle) n=1 Tax=Oryza sativa subsp. japonica TaxID=39947 RepID=Q6Z6M5_ORYSJ|nr:putative syntaxin-related protein(knolle) [Oryza sativa Japonica Group]
MNNLLTNSFESERDIEMGYQNSKNKSDYGLEDFFQEVQEIETLLDKMSNINHKLQNLENRKKQGCEKGTGVDRSRMSMTIALKNKLKERMKNFQNLRQIIQDEYRQGVARMVFTVTGEQPSDQIFADMATLVDAQGETLNDIENQVQNAVDHIQRGTGELRTAKRLQKKSRKCMFIAIIILLVIAAIVVLSILKPWAK